MHATQFWQLNEIRRVIRFESYAVNPNLAKCACHAASLLHASPEFPSTFNWAALSFDQELIRYGKHLIELALKRSEGSVTDAARLLDLSHQNLSSKIVRYKELAKFRKPIRQRKRSRIDSRNLASSLYRTIFDERFW